MSGAKRLGFAGFLATAAAFGPARNGYGLFLPYFREEFELSTELLGLIASGLYAGYLLALTAVGLLAFRLGPRLSVLVGLLSAALGMGLVALAPNAWVLAAGVVLAGTSAGWSWAPYNDVTDRALPPRQQDRVLSVVSTGTTFGILVSGLVALAAGAGWRFAWFAFVLGVVAAAVPNALVLPGALAKRARRVGRVGGGCGCAPSRCPCSPWRSPSGLSPRVTSPSRWTWSSVPAVFPGIGGERRLSPHGRGRLRRPLHRRRGLALRARAGAPRRPGVFGRRGLPPSPLEKGLGPASSC